MKMGTLPGFGVHVLLVKKSLKKLKGAHFEPQVQRPDNTALWQGFPPFFRIVPDNRIFQSGRSLLACFANLTFNQYDLQLTYHIW